MKSEPIVNFDTRVTLYLAFRAHSPIIPRITRIAAPAHPCARGIRPPWMAEVQKMQEQFSARPSLDIKKAHRCAFY